MQLSHLLLPTAHILHKSKLNSESAFRNCVSHTNSNRVFHEIQPKTVYEPEVLLLAIKDNTIGKMRSSSLKVFVRVWFSNGRTHADSGRAGDDTDRCAVGTMRFIAA
jgi:hypothetical protein